jgi:Recombination endonuclease VII
VAFTNEQHRKRYAEDAKHREKKLAGNRVYRVEHRERLNALWLERWRSDASYRERHALARLARVYGLSSERYRQMLEQQSGLCRICKGPPRRRLCVDHCDVTQQVRGLLCDNCNTGIGLLGHDPKRLRAAAAYLERAWRGSQPPRRGRSDGRPVALGAPPRRRGGRSKGRPARRNRRRLARARGGGKTPFQATARARSARAGPRVSAAKARPPRPRRKNLKKSRGCAKHALIERLSHDRHASPDGVRPRDRRSKVYAADSAGTPSRREDRDRIPRARPGGIRGV